jgi:hypothetical protein
MFVHDGLKVISICHDVFEEDGIKMMVRDFVNVGEPLLNCSFREVKVVFTPTLYT